MPSIISGLGSAFLNTPLSSCAIPRSLLFYIKILFRLLLRVGAVASGMFHAPSKICPSELAYEAFVNGEKNVL